MKLSKVFSISILSRGIYFLSVLILNILISRHYKAEGSGQIYYFSAYFALAVMLVSLSLEVPLAYFLSKRKLNVTNAGVFALCWWFITTIIVILTTLLITPYLKIPYSRNDFLLSSVCFISGNVITGFFVSLFYAKMKFALPNIILVIINLFLIILIPNKIFVSNFLTDAGYINIYFTGFLVQGLSVAVAYFISYFKKSEFSFLSGSLIRSIFSFAAVSLVTNILSFLMYRIDYLFVNKYCSAEALGNYIQACKLAQIFFIVPAIAASVIFPATAYSKKGEVNLKMQMISRTIIAGYGFVLFILVVTGHWLFPALFGESFTNMYVPFLFLIPGILAYSVIHLLASFFSGVKILRIGFLGNLLTLFVIIISDYFVIPVFGIKGAAAISSLAYLFLMTFMIIAHKKRYQSNFNDFLLFRKSDFRFMQNMFTHSFFYKKNDGI